MNPKVGVVILNYKNFAETIECVSCFLQQNYVNYEIVVVDNGSENESLQEIGKRFGMIRHVHLLKCETNLGFARGNNIGIDFCRKNLNCEWVIVINSDTTVSEDFIPKMIDSYYPGAGVVVPSVKLLDGSWQSPSVNCENLRKTIQKKYFEIMLMLILDSALITFLRRYLIKKRQMTVTKEPIASKYFLQGCAYMLTPDFFLKYNRLYPKTFLYWEELDLLWYLRQAGLSSCHAKNTIVIHKGGASTKYDVPSRNVLKVRHKRVLAGMIASTPLFLNNYNGIKRKYDID